MSEAGPERKGAVGRDLILEVLLKFSGAEGRVRAKYAPEWSTVLEWDPENRYRAIGLLPAQQAIEMVTCVERLLTIL